ncbi:MAG: protein of unknown function DUF1987-containing protein [Crocinitomicaceae bacterium]|jgi:hypothetical protein|nr:protein of unknown function DUF1987-containing protein [Crocinitomicaceae bacterium]
MENLILEGSAKTPSVTFNSNEGKLELKGRSIPENSVEFYKPLNDWIDSYGNSPKAQTVVDIKLEYFNTSSSKCILDLFKKLEGINGKGTEVSINWYFEEDDEDMEEAGEDYQAIISLPFKIIEVEEI